MSRREHKYRAWDPITKTMIGEGYHVIGEVTMFQLIEQWVYEHPDGDRPALERMGDIVEMQWTGFQDSGKKDIYENDIFCAMTTSSGPMWVVFERGCFVLYNKYNRWGPLSRAFDPDIAEHYTARIIGNLHQHPHLIQSKP
jgi:hypothetical protein